MACWHLSPAVDVKAAHRLADVTERRGDRVLHRHHGDVVRRDESEILQRHGERAHRLGSHCPDLRRVQRFEPQFERHRAARQPVGLGHLRMQFTRIPDRITVQAQFGATPRVPRRLLGAVHGQVHTSDLGDTARDRNRIRPRHHSPIGQRTGVQPLSDQHTRDGFELLGNRGIDLREFRVGRTVVDARLTSRFSGDRRQRDRPEFVDRQIPKTPTDIALRCLQQRAKERRAHFRLLRAQRVEQVHRLASPIVMRDQLCIMIGWSDERIIQHFDHAAVRQGLRDLPTQALARREPLSVTRDRQHRRNAVVPRESCNFLDELGDTDEIATPRWRRDRQRVGARHGTADRLQRCANVRLGNVVSDESRRRIHGERNTRDRNATVIDSHARVRAATVLDQQRNRARARSFLHR